ncbi:MAG TPA: hypothetical protein VGL13_10930 [Polyangiaceae bacterium]
MSSHRGHDASRAAASPADEGLRKLRDAWAACVHEAGHAVLAVVLGYELGFSDVSESLEFAADPAAKASSVPRTGFTRIFQIGSGALPDIAFAVAGRAAEAVHGLIKGLAVDQAFDVARWRHSSWGEDDDLKDAHAKALAEVGGSEGEAWTRVQREYRRTEKLLAARASRAATLEIASMLMRDGRVPVATILRVTNDWGIQAHGARL